MIVGVVDDFSKQAEAILFGTPSCPLYTYFFTNATWWRAWIFDGKIVQSKPRYLSLGMPIFAIIREISYEQYS